MTQQDKVEITDHQKVEIIDLQKIEITDHQKIEITDLQKIEITDHQKIESTDDQEIKITEKYSSKASKTESCNLDTDCKQCNNNQNSINNVPKTSCSCGLPSEKQVKTSSKISMSYSKLKKKKQKSRKSSDKKKLAKLEDCSSLPPQNGSWLLRLFESKLFNMPIAISYLFNSKENGVLAYLGNKLFVSVIIVSVLTFM